MLLSVRPAAFLFLISIALPSAAQEPEIELDATLLSRYAWRGIVLSDGPVAQTSLALSRGDWSAEVWSLRDLGRAEESSRELGIAVTRTFARGSFEIEAGLAAYRYPGQLDAPATAEIVVSLSRPIGAVELVSQQAYDPFRWRRAYYGDLGVQREGEWRGLKVDSALRVGWGSAQFNDVYQLMPEAGVGSLFGDLTVARRINDRMTVNAMVGFRSVVGRRLRDGLDDTDHAHGGIGVTFAF